MPINKADHKLVRNVAAALYASSPKKTTPAKLLKALELDIRFKEQTLAMPETLNYLQYFDQPIPKETFDLVKNSLKSSTTTFKSLLNLRFTEQQALDWMMKTTLDPVKAVQIFSEAATRLPGLMHSHRENIDTAFNQMMDKKSDFYIEGLTEQMVNELLTSELSIENKISAQIYKLEDDFQPAFDDGTLKYDKELLDAVARNQVLSNDFTPEHNPLVQQYNKAMGKPMRTPQQWAEVINTNYAVSSTGSAPLALSMSSDIINNPNILNAAAGVALFLAAAAVIGCVVLGPRSIAGSAARKIAGIFSDKTDKTKTQVPDNSALKEDKSQGLMKDYFYNRSTKK